jgi:S1-C subfamily serine protease
MIQSVEQLLARATRAFGGGYSPEILRRYRAVVGPIRSQDAMVKSAYDKLQDGVKPTPQELAALEQAIRAFRPSVLVDQGSVSNLPDEAVINFPEWPDFVEKIKEHLNTIGRVDFQQQNGRLEQDAIGTGFLIAPQILLTNCHVLDILSMGHRVLERGQGVVHFKQDQTSPDEDPVPISGVLNFDAQLDVAALKMDPLPEDGRQPVEFDSVVPPVGEPVVTIGYPFPDNERNPLFVDAAFGDGRLGVKRAAPGETLGLEDTLVYHDCSTLGGNSGSPLLSMATGRLVGLHRKGGFANRNEAVLWSSLREFVDHL